MAELRREILKYFPFPQHCKLNQILAAVFETLSREYVGWQN